MKPQLHQKISLEIKRLGIHGEGIGESQGFTLFVEGALPGETVTVSITEVRKNFARGKLISREKTSPYRVTPPCPVFGRCGGCQLQHLAYPQQLEAKRQRLVDALERIGKLFDVPVAPCVPSPDPYAYRNKIQLPVKEGWRMGLYSFNSHDLVEIDKCFIHCPLGEEAFYAIKKILSEHPEPSLKHVVIKTAVKTGQILVILVTSGEETLSELADKIMKFGVPGVQGVVQNINPTAGNTILSSTYQTLAGSSSITDQICGLEFKVSPASFFQVNPPQAENLYQKALKYADLKGEEIVLDAYCGVGTLSLLAAQKAKKVIGVESVPEAIADAQENAQKNGISNAVFTCAEMEVFIQNLEPVDVAFLNPPRKGCDPRVLEKLQASKIVYISCDPATLARDLALLKERGYAVQEATPFDMFPQTVHVESAVVLHNQ